MAWKENGPDGVPKLDFSHARVIAAMKVTGIKESDLCGPPPPLRLAQSARLAITDKPGDDKSGANTARSDALARSKDFWERKQRQLLREVEAYADAMDETEVEHILSPTHIDDEKLQEAYSVQKGSVESMRNRQLTQLQREAKREIARTMAVAEGTDKRDALEKRMAEEAAEKRALARIEADKRKLKLHQAQEKVKQAKKADREKQKETMNKLQAFDERLEKQTEEKKQALHDKSEDVAARTAKLKERNQEHERKMFETTEQQYQASLNKHSDVDDRLAMARLDKQDDIQARQQKFDERCENAKQKLVDQEITRNKNFLESAKKIPEKRELAAQKTQEMLAAIKARRDKELARFTLQKQRDREERKERHHKWKSNLADSQVKAADGRDRYLEELVFSKSGNRGMLLDAVEQNKARIERSEDHARGNTLAKIERDFASKETKQLQKEQLQSYRTHAIKEFMLGRQRVEELKRIDPSKGETSKKRMNDVLRELDMPPLETGQPKEGEEGEQK